MTQTTHSAVLIEDGETVSTTVVDVSSFLPSGIIVPAGFEGTALTFQGCQTETGTFLPLHDESGTAISVTVAASRHVLIEPHTKFAGVKYLKVVAGTAQTGDVTLQLVMFIDS